MEVTTNGLLTVMLILFVYTNLAIAIAILMGR